MTSHMYLTLTDDVLLGKQGSFVFSIKSDDTEQMKLVGTVVMQLKYSSSVGPDSRLMLGGVKKKRSMLRESTAWRTFRSKKLT